MEFERSQKEHSPYLGRRSTRVDVPGFRYPAVSDGQTPIGERPQRPWTPRVQNPDQTRQGQCDGPSGGAWANHPRWSSPASGPVDSPAQPQNPGLGHLLPHRCESSRLRSARSSHLDQAPILGTLATSAQINRMDHPALLASIGRTPDLYHLSDGPSRGEPSGSQRGNDCATCQNPRQSQSLRWRLGVLEHTTRTASNDQFQTGMVAQNATRPVSLLWAVVPT